MRILKLTIVAVISLSSTISFGSDSASGAKRVVEPFALEDVRLLDGPFRDAMERDHAYLLALDADRLLHTWRLNAGLPSTAEPLGGWERPECEVRGHTLGHFLSACSFMYASTGDTKIKAKVDYIVSELGKCQDALGNGYLSAFPESHIERAEKCEQVWAPYYCLHKLLAGLMDAHVHCENPQSLRIALMFAEWCQKRCDRLSREQMQAMLEHTEQGGMNDVLTRLGESTSDVRWLKLSRRFVQDRYVQPLARKEDRLKGEHANSFIPNIIGTARQYEAGGNPVDRRIAEYFWNQVTAARCYCTGGTSDREHWQNEPYELANQLSDHTQETCCTYNMLKLTRHLFCWEPLTKYGDYYERALYNSILSTQDPQTGMMMYFVTMAPGRWKYFNLPNDSFWCCTGTGLENHAKYGDSIYFHNDHELYVNLFVASEVMWRERDVHIRQETEFPQKESTAVSIKTERPCRFAMRVRIPSWTTTDATATLNGEPIETRIEPGSWCSVDRIWRNGDRLEVHLPMRLHASPMPDDQHLMAFMYGPLVLAGSFGADGLTKEDTYTPDNFYQFAGEKVAHVSDWIVDSSDPSDWIQQNQQDSLEFATKGWQEKITLRPYHELFGERYNIYWRVYQRGSDAHRKAEAARQAERKRLAREVDVVAIGDDSSEREHGIEAENSQTGAHQGLRWRHATDGGAFSYRMKVLPNVPLTLWCRYWGDESGPRTFHIEIDGKSIATQTLSHDKPGEFFEVEYNIPPALTKGKQSVTVRFQAKPGNFAGGVFGCAVLKPE
jgi:DUF1680 family protein